MINQARAASATADEQVVHMYPNNQLKGQVRPFEETRSAFAVIKEEFFNNK